MTEITDNQASRMVEDPRETQQSLMVAKIIDPEAWERAGQLMALTWNDKPAPATNHALSILAPSLAKADAIIAALAAAQVLVPGWETIATSPSDGRTIWVSGGRYSEPQLVQADGEWWRSGVASIVPTHWMPQVVPPSPTPDTEKEG